MLRSAIVTPSLVGRLPSVSQTILRSSSIIITSSLQQQHRLLSSSSTSQASSSRLRPAKRPQLSERQKRVREQQEDIRKVVAKWRVESREKAALEADEKRQRDERFYAEVLERRAIRARQDSQVHQRHLERTAAIDEIRKQRRLEKAARYAQEARTNKLARLEFLAMLSDTEHFWYVVACRYRESGRVS